MLPIGEERRCQPSSARALSFESLCGVDMADSNRQSVGSVRRIEGVFILEQAPDHELHLLFAGEPISDDRALDGKRRILRHRKTTTRRCQHCNSPHLTKFQRRLHIRREKDLLYRDDLWLMQRQKPSQLGVDLCEALRSEER